MAVVLLKWWHSEATQINQCPQSWGLTKTWKMWQVEYVITGLHV